MLGGGEVKVATVEAVESVDNMATLPVSRAHGGSDITPEKNNFTNKEMEAKKRPVGAVPMQPKRTSLFIVLSFIYAKLLVVVCIAFVVSEVVTHSLPIPYYEGFFTYLYGVSILFLLYVFCFLLQESTCCQATEPKPKKPKKEKEKEKENKKNKKKEAADKKKEKEESAKGGGGGEPQPPPAQQGKRNSRSNIFQNEVYPRKMKDLMRSKNALVDDIESNPNSNSGSKSELVGGMMGTLRKGKSGADSPTQEKLTDSADVESCPVPMPHPGRKRKTSQNTHSHGSFFLRVGAIAFGLATMIYNGLEFGEFFEIPFTSPCYQVLRGVNPLLQMMFTFMQMYFIFMNSRLNIHRFKVIARFGLMHIVATNLCVWIRTLVLESLKEITGYLQKRNSTVALTTPTSSVVRNLNNDFAILESLRVPTVHPTPITTATASAIKSTAQVIAYTAKNLLHQTTTAAATTFLPTTSTTTMLPTTTPTTTTTTTTTLPPFTDPTTTTTTTTEMPFFDIIKKNLTAFATEPPVFWDEFAESPLAPAALVSANRTPIDPQTCGRVNIMGSIVQDSAPYLFPFIIEYSLIGAAVIYVMWRHIGRHARYQGEEDLEQRLEVILSRRAVALAHANAGRVDCVGASKGLFFGLLLLVGSLICLILFFVLVHHPQLGLLAIYLADVSHCALMGLSIIAIIIGFIRVQGLKFQGEEQSDLNDILQRVSAFGLFVYAVFSVIAGALTALTSEPNLLVMITGNLSVVQVVLQLLFIADIARRRVHLPEHDRSKPGRQIVTFLLICNVTMWIIYTFETQKVIANPVQLDFYGFLAWSMVQRVTLPLCIFYRFHSAVTLAEIWKTSYKPRLD
ncbi:proton channel OtopLc-like isoform X2 [Homalodisca vitripennis]|nr:proton channel OtopLc-like isoform X2 [Homalodisca vitripennis]